LLKAFLPLHFDISRTVETVRLIRTGSNQRRMTAIATVPVEQPGVR
jgi:hypothetical protein